MSLSRIRMGWHQVSILGMIVMVTLLSHTLITINDVRAADGQDAGNVEAVVRGVLAEFYADGTRFPGATIGYVLKDGTAGSVSVGLADVETERQMTADDRMMAGSTGKTLFAALALQLIGEGVLDLDTKISHWLSDEEWFARLPNAETITLRHLLNHSSGIPRHVMSDAFVQALIDDPRRDFEPAELLGYVLDADALFAAGEGWAYADTNFVVAGLIIEKVTGDSCYNQIYQRILRPLELFDIVPTTSRDVVGYANGYVNTSGNLFQLTEAPVMADGRFVFNPQFEWAGGGFGSTPLALARWAALLYGGGEKVLTAQMQAVMRESVEARLGPGSRYGIGMMERPGASGKVLGHSGYFPGYLTEMAFYEEHGLALAFQVNTPKMSRALNPGTIPKLLDDCAETVVE